MSMTGSGAGGQPGGEIEEEYRVIKTSFSMTIRRDRYDIPVAIMGQWIVSASWSLTDTAADFIACVWLWPLLRASPLCLCICHSYPLFTVRCMQE